MMQLNGKVKYLFLIISSLNPINIFIKKTILNHILNKLINTHYLSKIDI